MSIGRIPAVSEKLSSSKFYRQTHNNPAQKRHCPTKFIISFRLQRNRINIRWFFVKSTEKLFNTILASCHISNFIFCFSRAFYVHCESCIHDIYIVGFIAYFAFITSPGYCGILFQFFQTISVMILVKADLNMKLS